MNDNSPSIFKVLRKRIMKKTNLSSTNESSSYSFTTRTTNSGNGYTTSTTTKSNKTTESTNKTTESIESVYESNGNYETNSDTSCEEDDDSSDQLINDINNLKLDDPADVN
jgi:hypothetical protein